MQRKHNLLNLDKYPYLWHKAAVYVRLFGSTCICEQAFILIKLNKIYIIEMANRTSDSPEYAEPLVNSEMYEHH